MSTGVTVKPFKTIVLGRYRNPGGYLTALNQSGCNVSDSACDLLANMEMAEPRAIELVKIAAAGHEMQQIWPLATERKLSLCPAEVGPALRLQYATQLHSERLRVSMLPIRNTSGFPLVFTVDCLSGARWLNAFSEMPWPRLAKRSEIFFFVFTQG